MQRSFSKRSSLRARVIASSVFLLFVCSIAQAQEWGDIEASDFDVELDSVDASADAVYLFKNCFVYYTFHSDKLVIAYEIHERIKILNEDGEDYANFDFNLYSKNAAREKIVGLKAISCNLSGNSVVETKLDKKQIFDEDINEVWKKKSFALPNVKPGTIIDLKYKFISPNVYTIDRWNFQEDIPVKFSEYAIEVPSGFAMAPNPTGFVTFDSEYENFSNAVFSGTKYTFTAEGIPAMKDDDYVLNIDDYRSSIKYELSSVQYNSRPTEYLSSSWDEIANDLHYADRFGVELVARLRDLDSVVEKARSLGGDEGIRHIYDFVQGTYSWNEEYCIYADGLNDLVKTKSGSVADINLLLTNLLIKAGYFAKPVVLKARYSGLLNSQFPSVSDFNYVLSYVSVGGKPTLLDATSKYVPIGNLPLRATNLNCLVVDKKNGTILDTQTPNLYEYINMINYELDLDNESMVGNGKIRYSNYAAVKKRQQRNQIVEDDSQEFDEEDEEEDEDDELNEDKSEVVKVDGEDDLYKPITYTIEETLFSPVKMIEDKIFIDAALDFGVEENPFTEDQREFPVFFNYDKKIRTSNQITIPEGYQVDFLPEGAILLLGENSGKFTYECKEINGKILIGYYLEMNDDFILPSQYGNVKEFYRLIIEKENEKIVFKKI